MSDIIFDYIKKARRELEERNTIQAELLYTKSIEEINRRIKSVDIQKKRFWMLELWLTLSEFLSMRSDFPKKNETFEESRKLRLDSLRYLHKAITSSFDYTDESHVEKLNKLQELTIYKFGCILSENGTQLEISCPIYIRNSLPFPPTLSLAFAYEKNLCSICKKDMVDESCNHIPGTEYDGKRCAMMPSNPTLLHTAIVDRPKDPRCMVIEISLPKKSFMDKLTEEDRIRKLKHNLPLICYFCRDHNIRPSEISTEKFFEMQKIDIDIDESNNE